MSNIPSQLIVVNPTTQTVEVSDVTEELYENYDAVTEIVVQGADGNNVIVVENQQDVIDVSVPKEEVLYVNQESSSIEVGAFGTATGGVANAPDIRALGFFDTTNDGHNSGLDADFLDGHHASYFEDRDDALQVNIDLANDAITQEILDRANADSALQIALQAEIDTKSDDGHIHDDRYYTETEVDSVISTVYSTLRSEDDSHSAADRSYTDGLISAEESARIAADALKLNLTGGTVTGVTHFERPASQDHISLANTTNDLRLRTRNWGAADIWFIPNVPGGTTYDSGYAFGYNWTSKVWGFQNAVRSYVDPVNASDLTRKSYVDSEVDAVQDNLDAHITDLNNGYTFGGGITASSLTADNGSTGLHISSDGPYYGIRMVAFPPGGWARALTYMSHDEASSISFGAYASEGDITHAYIGTAYNDTALTVDLNNYVAITKAPTSAAHATRMDWVQAQDDAHQAAAEATAAAALAAHITDLNNDYTFGGDVYANNDIRGLTTLRIGAGAFTGGAGFTQLDANQLRAYTSEGNEGTLYLQHSGGTLNIKNGAMTFASDGAISVTKPTSFTGGHTHDINGNLTLTGRITQASTPSSDNHLVRLQDLNAEIADLLGGANTFAGNNIFTGGVHRLYSDSPYIDFWDTNGTVDQRRWEIGVGNDDFRIRNLLDSGATDDTQVIISVNDINLKVPVSMDDDLTVGGFIHADDPASYLRIGPSDGYNAHLSNNQLRALQQRWSSHALYPE